MKTNSQKIRVLSVLFSGAVFALGLLFAPAQGQGQGQGQGQEEELQEGHNHPVVESPRMNFLSDGAREAINLLLVQDFQGRMKPIDTLARESVMKVTKRHHFKDWEPIDLFFSWMAHPDYWYEQPMIAVRYPDLKRLLGISEETTHVSLASLIDESGQYRLREEMQRTQRTPDRDRTKVQRKLISFDERVNVFNMGMRGFTQRIFPAPNDDNNTWFAPADLNGEVAQGMDAATLDRFQNAFSQLFRGVQAMDSGKVELAARQIGDLQYTYGASVMPSASARKAELRLNKLQPFTWASVPYLIAFVVLMAAYAWNLARMNGRRFSLKHPLYLLGIVIYVGTVLFHIYGYELRWRASGRAPLSNGYESLVFISLTIAIVGLYYELRGRRGSIGALGAMMTSFILGVAMLPTFDPAISPLVPVLASFWLIIHVTVITASYGFLSLGAVIALTMLVLNLFKGPGRLALRRAIVDLHLLHWNVLIAGLAFLSVGTFLGGVWANESWGRYWGWDPKETWSLVTILVYAFVVHFKFVESLNHPLKIAAGSFLSIFSIAMTYFGVNYFLSGLHSYASGDAPSVPQWVYVAATLMILLVIASFAVDRAKSWEEKAAV